MASWQSLVIRLSLNYLKATVDFAAPIRELRRKAELAGHLVWLPRDVAVTPVMAGGVPAEWLWPAGVEPTRVILYLHGGGYAMCSCNTHRAVVARIAKAGRARALLLEYRLAPEHPFPAALEDAIAAYCWLLENGISPQQIIIAGDSAGGGLALATLLSVRDRGLSLPAAAVCLSPLTDLTGTGESMKRNAQADPWLTPQTCVLFKYYIGQNDPCSPLFSPIYADLRNLPPVLIQVGGDEILLSDATRLAERAQAAGVEIMLEIWPHMWHVFQAFAPYLPEARQAIAVIGQFVQQRLNN